MKIFLKSSLVCYFIVMLSCTNEPLKVKETIRNIDSLYACVPCGYICDTTLFTKLGTCTSCNMALVKKETIKHKNISIGSLCFLTDSNTIFLDVRTPEEFNGTAKDNFGAIKNAINIPVQELEKRKAELVKFKNKTIVVYCSHAHRSAMASYKLTQNGFSNVNNMLGGLSVWKKEMKNNSCNSKLYLPQ